MMSHDFYDPSIQTIVTIFQHDGLPQTLPGNILLIVITGYLLIKGQYICCNIVFELEIMIILRNLSDSA